MKSDLAGRAGDLMAGTGPNQGVSSFKKVNVKVMAGIEGPSHGGGPAAGAEAAELGNHSPGRRVVRMLLQATLQIAHSAPTPLQSPVLALSILTTPVLDPYPLADRQT